MLMGQLWPSGFVFIAAGAINLRAPIFGEGYDSVHVELLTLRKEPL